MTKKTTIAIVFAFLVAAAPVLALAVASGFIANGDITIKDVNYAGFSPVDMTVLNTSTAQSFTYDSGDFTVLSPSGFMVACASSTVKAIKASGPSNQCVKNSNPGVSYLNISGAGTYTITPEKIDIPNSATYNSECGAATCDTNYTVVGSGAAAACCPTLPGTIVYNAYPTCGASACDTGYLLVGSGSGAVCSMISGGGGGGGGGTGLPASSAEPVCQVYDPATGQTVECDPETETTPTSETEEELKKVSDIPGTPATDKDGNVTLDQMEADAETIFGSDINNIITQMGVSRDADLEKSYEDILNRVVGDTEISEEKMMTILYFITYGTKSTKRLGAGERAGVVNSFKAAFGKLPSTLQDWFDIIKIANGRWPDQRSEEAEKRAKETFKKIYLREADMKQGNDNAAVTVMAYGLRPANRNMESEKTAIRTFRAIFGKDPSLANDWDAVRAIAYSGAVR